MKPLLTLLAALLLATPAWASEQRPTQAEVEAEIMCPACKTTLDQSDAPVAERMKALIARRIAAGDTKSEIKDALVAEFGEEVLAAPPRRGFDLLAWLLPLGGSAIAFLVLGALARRWAHARTQAVDAPAPNGRAPLDPALERRLDEELARFER